MISLRHGTLFHTMSLMLSSKVVLWDSSWWGSQTTTSQCYDPMWCSFLVLSLQENRCDNKCGIKYFDWSPCGLRLL